MNMRTNLIFALVLAVVLSAASISIANAAAPTGSAAVVTATPTPAPKWSGEWNSKYQFSLHTSEDARQQASAQSILKLVYRATPDFTIQGVIGGTQAIRPSLDFRIYNPEFRGFYNLSKKEDTVKFSIGPTLVAPLGSDAKDESLYFGAGAGGRMVVDTRDEDSMGFRGFYDLTFNKNFHQYQTSVYAEMNNQLSVNHTVYLEYNFAEVWCLNTSIGFSSLWNYAGVLSNNYSIEQELDFSLTDSIMLYASHARGGDFLSANGQNYSFGIFSPNDSRVSMGLALTF